MRVKNVIARERGKHSLTQHRLASQASVTRQVITQLEAFALAKVPHEVARILDPKHPETICTLYEAERNGFLSENKKILLAELHKTPGIVEDAVDYAMNMYSTHSSPLILFRTYVFDELGWSTSQVQFCRFTGLHPAVASKVETGKVPWENIGSYLDTLKDYFKPTNEQLLILAKIHDDYYIRQV